jgi:hypothetical protein
VRDFPLFPLDLVALPHELIPLHIFEERFKTMMNECLRAESEFGIVRLSDDSLREIGFDDVRPLPLAAHDETAIQSQIHRPNNRRRRDGGGEHDARRFGSSESPAASRSSTRRGR